MKITLFTSNNLRHIYLINSLLKVCDELNVVLENKTIFPGRKDGQYQKLEIIEKYFTNVEKAQKFFFKSNFINVKNKKLNVIPIEMGDLNLLSKNKLKNFLNSDVYVVFGSSYIKGWLANCLVKKKAINIHMGISPYYRGTDCNFWALYDNKPEYVGATIHYLSKGLDSGPILYHALAKPEKCTFRYTMKTVKSAIDSICIRINNRTIFNYRTVVSNQDKLIRYTRNIDFNDKIVSRYNRKKIQTNFKFNSQLYIRPYILK
jgi:folate-dependent phosphoribosylglycinamide formyltransferase PurN